MNVLDESDRPISYRNPLPQFIAKKVPTLSHHSASLQQRLQFTARQHPWMLYGLSPPAKRKYSNLKQLVGWQIVKRNKKKSIAGVTSGRWTTATQGDWKGACHLAKVTLSDYAHIGNITGTSMPLNRGGGSLHTQGWCQLSTTVKTAVWTCSCQEATLL